AKKTGPKERAKGAADLEITLDAGHWADLGHAERLALIDEALARFKVVRDKKGNPQADDRGRPRLRTRAYNVELGYLFDVCRRHKDAVLAVKALAKLRAQFEELGIPWPTPEGLFA